MASPKYNTKENRKQDLILERQKLKQFRKDVSTLKKKGLIDKTKYDARKVLNTGGTGKYLKSQIKKFADVISGSAQPVKVSKEKQTYYKNKGYKIKSGKVIVPVNKNEKVFATRGDFRTVTTHPSGKITKIDLGLSKDDITLWREQLIKKKIRLGKDERIAFQFFGNNSYQTFKNTDELLDYLERYDALLDAEMSGDPSKMAQLIENVVIFKIERSAAWSKSEYIGTEKHEKQKERNRQIRDKWFSRMSQEQYNEYADKRANYERERRAKLKSDPNKYESEKEKARLRAKKSYETKKKK